jgi:hypothetical protein
MKDYLNQERGNKHEEAVRHISIKMDSRAYPEDGLILSFSNGAVMARIR